MQKKFFFPIIIALYLSAMAGAIAAPRLTQMVVAKESGNDMQTKVLVLFQSESGGTYKLAQAVAKGIETVPHVKAVLRQVRGKKEFITTVPVASVDELSQYDGIALGSAVHFGGSTPEMRSFWDGTTPLWTKRGLEGKPATVFMSAGSGAGREAAVLSLWSVLALHGMVIVPSGMMGNTEIDKHIAQGVNPFGTVALTGMPGVNRPSPGELHVAYLQGQALAKAARAIQQFRLSTVKEGAPASVVTPLTSPNTESPEAQVRQAIDARIAALGLHLQAPAAAGNYVLFKRVGKLVFINQIALRDGKVINPGLVGAGVSESQAREATRLAMTNVLAILQQATEGDWSRVKQTVQLTGYFNTPQGYTQHASLMNEASDLLIKVLGEAGRHTRATVGAASLPLDSVVEIQAVFELTP